MKRSPTPLLPLVLVLVTACACASSSSGVAREPAAVTTRAPESSPFSKRAEAHRLTFLHTSDNESDLLGSERDDAEAAPHGGVARAVTLVRALAERAGEPVVVLAAGDTWMPAPELRLSLDGKNAVMASNTLLGYRASALGNHEWDLGDAFLAEQLEDASYPYLSATIDVTQGPLVERTLSAEQLSSAGPWARESAGKLLPRTRLCVGALAPPSAAGPAALSRCQGVVVGVVGATTEQLRGISNVPDHVGLASSLDEVRARVQAQVDALEAEGVHVIVLLSHLQDVRKEIRLVEQGLTGVDVIVAGGGDNRLASTQHRLLPDDEPDRRCASAPDACYPLVLSAEDGRAVLVVATDGQLRYVGALSVGFDERGDVTGVSAGSRPWPVDEESLLELRAAPVAEAVAFESRVHDELVPRATPFAEVALFLEGRRDAVRNRQTNLGDLSADAMLWAGRRHAPEGYAPAFALRNGGGIRAPIGHLRVNDDKSSFTLEGGPLRPIDIESALRFDGDIVIVRTTHAVLRETLEAALRGAGSARGQFPQVSEQVLLEYTTNAAEQQQRSADGHVTGVACPGARVRTLKLRGADGDVVTVVEDGRLPTPDAKVDFVTLSFLAEGGDGWFPGRTDALESVTLAREGGDVTEQWTLRAFIENLMKQRRWNGGVRWRDPVVGQPDTFTRIKQLDVVIEAGGDACRP